MKTRFLFVCLIVVLAVASIAATPVASKLKVSKLTAWYANSFIEVNFNLINTTDQKFPNSPRLYKIVVKDCNGIVVGKEEFGVFRLKPGKIYKYAFSVYISNPYSCCYRVKVVNTTVLIGSPYYPSPSFGKPWYQYEKPTCWLNNVGCMVCKPWYYNPHQPLCLKP